MQPITFLNHISKSRLEEALANVKKKIGNKSAPSDMADKVSSFPKEEYLDRIVVKDRNKINIIPVDQIRYFESMDDYVNDLYQRRQAHKTENNEVF